MSGICGVWAFHGGEPDLEPVLALLERRGPEGTSSWADGPVALGHTLLATTPEALVEALPLTDEDSGCTITADARIDNRDVVLPALGLAEETRTIGDGELILRAYLKWGEECPKHLLGDFAFAIWDPRAPRLFCARDHMGMRQFNYCHAAGKIFAFATEDTALLAIEAVPKALNEGRIADFIADLEGYDFSSTFFEAILRLPPAHSLTLDERGCRVQRYWELRPPPLLQLGSDQAYADAFLEVFTEAVRCRLRHSGKIGAMLSGGLDSSSIVAVAVKLLTDANAGPLSTISAVGVDASQCAETRSIQSVLTIGGLNPISVDNVGFGGNFDALVKEMDDVRNPFEIDGTMLRCIYLTAKENSISVVLDGGAGDVTLTSDNIIASLLRVGKVKRAFQEALAAKRFWRTQRPLRFLTYKILPAAWVAYAPISIRLIWRRVRHFRPLVGAKRSFARQVDFASRRQAADKHLNMRITADAARRAQSILHPNLASGRERFDQLSASCAVECRDPFMDVRLIEFCLSLPPEQTEAAGWPKIILRRAMRTLLPQEVVWRRGKEHLGGDFTLALLARWNGWQAGMFSDDTPLKRYVSDQSLRDLRRGTPDPARGLTLPLHGLDRFLRRHRFMWTTINSSDTTG
jgi:asparagine synthase (glutamine-hydrolysing)